MFHKPQQIAFRNRCIDFFKITYGFSEHQIWQFCLYRKHQGENRGNCGKVRVVTVNYALQNLKQILYKFNYSCYNIIPRFASPRSASASKLRLFKISVISKLRRSRFSLRCMFRNCVVSVSVCVVNTKIFVQG